MEKDFVDLYSQTDLAKREKKSRITIATGKRYIKIRLQTARSRAGFKLGTQKSPYTYKYICWDDVKRVIEKQFGKKITFN